MKTFLTKAAFAIAVASTAPAFAQNQITGTSAPPPAMVDATPDATPDATADTTPGQASPAQKPSPAVSYVPGSPAASSYSRTATPYGPYVPYAASGSTGSTPARAMRDPDAEIVTSVAAAPSERRADEDAGIVTYVPSRAGEVPEGTLLRVRLRETLSTTHSQVGDRFSAEVIAPMERDGRVVIPVGSILEGRLTEVHGGRRVAGAAAIHLKTDQVTLPDGSRYILHAQVIDTEENNVTRVDREGTILRRDHIKGTLAAMSVATGGAAAAGAVFGGVPGALIGGGIGAGISTIWWLKQDRQEVIPHNTQIVFSLSVPMVTTPMNMGSE
jgi:hypothetical protein